MTEPSNAELTDEEKRESVCRLVFGGDPAKLEAFRNAVKEAIPHGTAAVLRGSAVTGKRWKDGAPFDAAGPGTSDLDLTLVGEDVIGLFKLTAFYVPGVHSRPMTDDEPDLAPALVPLRQTLIAMTGRPVSIQGTRDWVMHFRGDLIGQPYLTLIEKET